MTEIMVTKLLPPRIGGELIERPRLLEVFGRNRELKLMVVAAPAGYGKTVAVLQYVNTLLSPFVWYQLDSYDNDPAVYVQYLIAGFQKYFPGFGSAVLNLALQGNIASSLRFIVVSIVNELAGLPGGDFLLVLDDYHHISSPIIHQFMAELLEHLPAAIRVIIVGRTTPDLPLSRFHVHSELEIIDSDSLRFTAAEVDQFLAKKRLNTSGQQLNSLIDKAGGWPAALKLLTGAAGKAPAPSAQETTHIYHYLANEVFDRQPEATRNLMLAAAVFETITPEMCDILLERNDSEDLLNSLEKQQLFLIRLDGADKAYRYHQLFRDFLIEQLGPRKKHLLHKAGIIAFQQGNYEQAVEYYLASGINRDLMPMMVKAGKEALRQGRWQTVERWLGMLPPEEVYTDEWLCFFQAQIKIYQGNLDEAETWVGRSLGKFTANQDSISSAECQFLQARILNGHGRNKESLAILEQAYPVLQQAEPRLRFDLPLEMAFALSRIGRFQEANQLLNQSLQAAEAQKDYGVMAYLWEGLGHTYYWMGDHTKALQCYQKGIKISPDQSLPSYNFQDFIASIYQEWGELDTAFEYAQRSVAYKENLGMIEALPSAYYQLGNIYVDLGELEKAEASYRQGINLAENGGERHFLSLNKAYLTRCLGFQGRLAESAAIAEEVLAEAQTQSETLLACCKVICAPAFIQTGNFPKGKSLLLEALPPLEHWGFAVPLSYGYATLAVLSFKTGDLRQAGELSRKLLDLAARKNLIRLFLAIAEYRIILRYGLEHGIEVPYIQRVLIRMKERGVSLLKELMHHPDPKVRVLTILPLSQLNSPAARELLALLSNDLDPDVRRSLQHYTHWSGDSSIHTEENTGLDISAAPAALPPKQSVKLMGSESDSETVPFPLLQICLLGPTRIILNNADITVTNWRFTKSRDLLLYLCHHGQPVGINQILEDLWPDIPQEKSIKVFYSVLYWLRQTIKNGTPVELLNYASKTCVLLPSGYTTDRDRFIFLVNAGTDDIGASQQNFDALEEAVALYRGEYLNQLDYPWVIPEREHLKRLYLETVIRLAKFYLQSRDYLKAVEVLEPLAEENPLREEICGLLMSAHSALGDRLAVIRCYQRLKSNLAEELGLEPPPEITKLYYKLCGSETGARKGLKKA